MKGRIGQIHISLSARFLFHVVSLNVPGTSRLQPSQQPVRLNIRMHRHKSIQQQGYAQTALHSMFHSNRQRDRLLRDLTSRLYQHTEQQSDQSKRKFPSQRFPQHQYQSDPRLSSVDAVGSQQQLYYSFSHRLQTESRLLLAHNR